jgi:hypothetical protein
MSGESTVMTDSTTEPAGELIRDQHDCRYAWWAAGCGHVCNQADGHDPPHTCYYCGLPRNPTAEPSGQG